MSTNNKQVPRAISESVSSSSSEIVATPSTKTMQQLLNEIDQVTINAKENIKTLEKIDTRPKNAIANRDRLIEGRRQIQTLTERINDLEKQMNAMTKESDPNWPIKKFDKSKQNALNTLSDLLNKLKQVDQHLEKATETIPVNDQPSTASSVSTQNENSKRFGSPLGKFSFGKTKKAAPSESNDETTSDEEENEENDDDRHHTANKKEKSSSIPQSTNNIETSSDESEDDENNNHQTTNEIQRKKLQDGSSTDSDTSENSSETSTSSNTNKKPSITKVQSKQSSPPIFRKTTVGSTSSSVSHEKTSSSQEHTVQNNHESDDDDDDELKRLYERGVKEEEEEEESIHGYEQTEEDESNIMNAHVQELRMGTYSPGTQFRVINNLKGLQTGDLTINKGEILILVEQKPDDWWLFKNSQTQQQGLVPINHIRLQSRISDKRLRNQIKSITSPLTFVDALKTKNDIPTGFIASDLGSLTQHNQYKLSHTLIPKMTESNFTFTDLHWRYDTDQIYLEQVKYQKILRIQKCSKIPRIKGQQIDVLCRCVRICLHDGFKIISNIHAIRAHILNKIDERDLTEDWYFAVNNDNTFIDEQTKLLIRSNEFDPSKHLYLLIELSQLCQLKENNEKCEIGCGWIMIPFDDNQFSVMRDKKTYNELLHGGHFHELDILLDSQYKNFPTDGLSGRFNRRKQARIRFSLESREKYVDLLYDNLPVTSMIIPINLIQILFFYRNELAYQLQKRYHSYNLSTTPLDSIFLSTFYEVLEQPDLICALNKLYHQRKELNYRQQREEFIKIYELCIYPLLFYRQLPLYDFQNESIMNHRRKLIKTIINQQLSTNKNHQPDILNILLDPNLTDKWTLFTTDEICFSLQKYVYNFTS
ncbi:unnamed protein product [Rotaria sordida]|uniref:SH3 domain-containing protein n=1 Tax=Rotaria sordida TaxID=392033 RepID=A0A813SCA3_9BILA|nr:unnamed protein product [Rotaria sordida]CAF3607805.1 unnamed protein product [Rotaria sordida]